MHQTLGRVAQTPHAHHSELDQTDLGQEIDRTASSLETCIPTGDMNQNAQIKTKQSGVSEPRGEGKEQWQPTNKEGKSSDTYRVW